MSSQLFTNLYSLFHQSPYGQGTDQLFLFLTSSFSKGKGYESAVAAYASEHNPGKIHFIHRPSWCSAFPGGR